MGAKVKGYVIALIVVFLVSLAGGLIWSANHYSGLYEAEKKNTEKEKTRADSAESLAKQRQSTIDDMQVRQRDVAALDEKYTGELADAKSTIETLRDDVAAGRRRLQLNATCQQSSTASPGVVGNVTDPELSADAKRDYYRLRDGIETVTGQVNYLQQYIREQCLK